MTNSALRRSCLTLALLAGLALPACQEENATSAAIQRARLALDKISLPLTPLADDASADQAERGLAAVVTDLRPATSEGSTGQKQAANILLAQAQLGIGDRRAAYATRAERGALAALAPMRVTIDTMLSEGSRASALMAYDPAPAIAQLQALITSKEAEIAQRQRDRAQIEADILLLRQGAQERLTMASARRDEAARQSSATLSMPASEAGRAMEEVHRIRREADAIELDGANLLARAEVRQPELDERDMLVAQVVSQKNELEAALALTRQRAQDATTTAGRHAASFVESVRALDELIEGAIDHRNAAATPLVDSAIEAYTSAASSARAAGNDAVALAGAAAQGRGDMFWLRAQNLQMLADILEQVAQTPLPAALSAADRADVQGTFESYASRAAQLRTSQQEALAAAAEAYGEARDAFQRVRGDDDASRARVNRLAQLMHLCRRAANGAAIDLNSITDEQGDFTEEAPTDAGSNQGSEDAPADEPATEG